MVALDWLSRETTLRLAKEFLMAVSKLRCYKVLLEKPRVRRRAKKRVLFLAIMVQKASLKLFPAVNGQGLRAFALTRSAVVMVVVMVMALGSARAENFCRGLSSRRTRFLPKKWTKFKESTLVHASQQTNEKLSSPGKFKTANRGLSGEENVFRAQLSM